MKYSISGIALALSEQHGFDHDIAFLCVWYSVHDEPPKISRWQMMANMAKVKNKPELSEQEAEYYLSVYSRRKRAE